MNVIEQITDEVARATMKFPTWPTDPLHALAVLGEEFGELTKAMLQHTYEPHKGVTQQNIREEAIQTAAMALRLAMSLGNYRYAPCHQHSQSEPPKSELVHAPAAPRGVQPKLGQVARHREARHLPAGDRMKTPVELDAIADVVLAYKPKPKTKAAKRRKRRGLYARRKKR